MWFVSYGEEPEIKGASAIMLSLVGRALILLVYADKMFLESTDLLASHFRTVVLYVVQLKDEKTKVISDGMV